MMQIYYRSEGTSGETLSTLDKTMIALNMMASDQFQRSGAIIGGVTQPTVSRVLVQFLRQSMKFCDQMSCTYQLRRE